MSKDHEVTHSPPVVQSVDRAFAALEILARDGWVGVTEIARELDTHKSTAFRLLSTLERRGVVEQHSQTQKYRLGFALARLGSSVRSSLDLVETASPVCDRLSLETDEAVNLAVLEGHHVVNIYQVNHSNSRVTADWSGSHTDLHCTASGKVFLAHLADRIVNDLLSDGLERHTEHTLTTREALEEEFEQIRRDGYALTCEELEVGLNAVAALVGGSDGEPMASVSVSAPSYRFDEEQQERAAELVKKAAEEISQRLGFATERTA